MGADDRDGRLGAGESSDPIQTWRVRGLEQGIDEPDSRMRERALAAVGLAADELRGFRIARRSLDARRRGGHRSLRYAVSVDLLLEVGHASPGFDRAVRGGRAVLRPEPGSLAVAALHPTVAGARVVVVGAGPAGLFAALTLALAGIRVDLVDRGGPLRERGRSVAVFGRTRQLDPESNLLYGEGGAGTYSDGKLYTRIDHPLEVPILEELVVCGAPREILFDARAHIGTDRLHGVLRKLRTRLEDRGVRFHWHTRVEGWEVAGSSPQRIRALSTAGGGTFACDAVILALGHSARDSIETLSSQGLVLASKPFQFGVRIEHPQVLVTTARHGESGDARLLGPAYYGLVCKAGDGLPGAHSFCMCPGGQIVASVSEPGALCTNGMSNSRHSSRWANAALVVTLSAADYGPGALAGVEFQRKMERAFFAAGGGDYTAPAQRAPDFLAGRISREPGESSYKLGTRAERIDALLPERVRDALRRALHRFDASIPGFAGSAGLLVGIESRSSSPVRIPRDAARRAEGFSNLYPVGEGAGYAGGITSSAIDGARSAQVLLTHGLDAKRLTL